jgi:hypothetical protein|nr:hypothetical protein [Neorhizobium tomejilense]
MGGKVAVGIIEEDGSFKTVTAWSNPLPPAMQSEAFVKGDYAKLREYIDYYEHDRGDQGYGPSGNIPSGYGYFLIDLREKTMLSAQGYTTIDSYLGIQIKSAMRQQRELSDGLARMVTHIMRWNEEDGEMQPAAVGPFRDAAHMSEMPDPWYVDGDMFGMVQRYVIRFDGWIVSNGGRTPGHLEKVRDYLNERTLLSFTELEAWNEQIAALEVELDRMRNEQEDIPEVTRTSFAP